MPVGSEKPKEAHLKKFVTKNYAVHWKRIGILLNIEEDTLNKIALNNNEVSICCNAMWNEWLSKSITASWDDITNATDCVHVITHLQAIYKEERDKDMEDEWALHQPENFANVSMIYHKEKNVSQQQIHALATAQRSARISIGSLQGDSTLSSDYILTCKRTKNVSDIFDPNIKHNTILVEGAPGIGKTVFSKEIAFQWANEKLLCNKPFLFLIHLRDPQVTQIKTLNRFVYYVTRSSQGSKLVKLTEDYLNSTHGKICTIVLDGFDEISEKLKVKKDSFIGKIIKRRVLDQCGLVITSRPSASADLYKNADCRVEILGFTKADRNEFIRLNLQGTEIEKFQEYLKNNPFINDLCYIPLNMTILLGCFKESMTSDNQELPKTQTDINNQFIFVTMSRYITRQKKKTVTIKSPDDLQVIELQEKEPYKQQFDILCKLAFYFLGNDKVVFSDGDIQKYLPEEDVMKWSTLGLLKEVCYYTFLENKLKTSYSYLHLSIQECLAAHYIISAKEEEKVFLSSNFWDSKYLNTGVMYVGLTKGESQAFKVLLHGSSGTLGKWFGTHKDTVHDKVKQLHFFNCLLEAKQDLSESQIDKILFKKIIDLSDHILQQKDFHTLSFFLARSVIKNWKKLDLSNCFITEDHLKEFSKMTTTKVMNVSISLIDLSGNVLSQSVDDTIELINCFSVKKLIIADQVAEDLRFREILISSITKIKEVVISSSSNNIHFLINYKQDNTKQIYPKDFEFVGQVHIWNTDDFSSIYKLIKKCKKINIYKENIPEKNFTDITVELDAIRVKTTYVLQSTNKIFAYGAELYQISQSFKSHSFLNESKSSDHWKIVNLKDCTIGDKDFAKFTQVLQGLHFDKLDVSQCFLTIPAQLEILKCCIIKHLIISNSLMYNEQICNCILNEVKKDSKIYNFKMAVPLMLSTEQVKNIFFVNCAFTGSIIEKYDWNNSKMYFSNIKLCEHNIQSFLMICKSNKLQISLFETNLTDKIMNDILMELPNFGSPQEITYVLASNTTVIAYKGKDEQIMEAIDNSSAIVAVKLMKCKVVLSQINPFGNILSKSSQNWEVIDLSGCDIKDEDCLALYECLHANTSIVHINILNLSLNSLTENSVIYILRIFECCIIKSLIISRNDIPSSTFNTELHTHLLAQRNILNFTQKIPLLVYESVNNQHSYEICNVYASEMSILDTFIPQTGEDEILYNLYRVYIDQSEYTLDLFLSISLTSSMIKVDIFVEGIMNEIIMKMIAGLVKATYDKDTRLSKIDLSCINITAESCKLLFGSLFNDNTPLIYIGELDLSSHKFSLGCICTIVESFHYGVIKKLIFSNREALDMISENILQVFCAEKKICNFIENIPLTVISNPVVIKSEGDTNNIVANTYLRNYQVTEDLLKSLNIDFDNISSHTLILFDCLEASSLNNILSILPFLEISLFELNLSNDSLMTAKEQLLTYGHRNQFVLATKSKLVAYNAQQYQILSAVKTLVMINDLEIIDSNISMDGLKEIALCKKFKNLKFTDCKIRDEDLHEFSKKLYSASGDLKTSVFLNTIDISHNCLTSSSVNAILTFLKCSVIEKLIVSNNSINNIALTDAIFQQACSKEDTIHNLKFGTPLVIINTNTQQDNPLNNMKNLISLFIMNCAIDEKVKDLVLEYCTQVNRIFFVNNVVANTNLGTNLLELCHTSPNVTKVYVYERDLKDEMVQETATCLTRETKLDISFILTSTTRIYAENSTDQLIAPLLDNSSIATLQLNNVDIQFSSKQFLKSLSNTSRYWDKIDLSCCHINDDCLLKLKVCFVASKSTIRYVNFKNNDLSSFSAAPIASIILSCHVKKLNISCNKLQDIQVYKVLDCLMRKSPGNMSAEIFTSDHVTIVASNTNPKDLQNLYETYSSGYMVQLSIRQYKQFEDIQSIFKLSSFVKFKNRLSQVILQDNGLEMEQIEEISKLLPTTEVHIRESYVQYNFNLTDFFVLNSIMANLLKISKIDDPVSLIVSKVENNKICLCNIKALGYSAEDNLIKFINWQMNTTVEAIKLSNCYITHNIAKKLAYFIKKISDLKLFELSYNHIQESDLKSMITALKSTKSLIFFSIKSIDCFSEDTAADIASIIARNKSIKFLEISSNCKLTQSVMITIVKSIKEHWTLKQVTLNNSILTQQALTFALSGKGVLEHINFSHCKLQEVELIKISSLLKNIKLSSINLSYNNITNTAADALKSLFGRTSLTHLDMSYCNLQEKGMSYIVNALKSMSLAHLNFSGNKITDVMATEMSTIIAKNSCIECLDLSNCNLKECGIEIILTSLKEHSHLKTFKASSFALNMEALDLFKCVLESNKQIENLTLQGCHCEQTFNAVREKATSVQFLDIHFSKISFHNLMSIVANNKNLKHLNISKCDIHGEPDISDGDFSGLFLEYLNLAENRITKTFAKYISKLICISYELKHLNIASCEMEESELVNITNALTMLSNLSYLNCSNNTMNHQIASNIVNVINNNVYLEHLDISLCCLTKHTFSPIANALKQLETLKYLNIGSCRISFDITSTFDQKLPDTQYHDTISTTASKVPQPCSSENASINREVILKATHSSCYHEIENSCDFDTRTTEINLNKKISSSNLDFHDNSTQRTIDEPNLGSNNFGILEANGSSYSSDDQIKDARKFSADQLQDFHDPVLSEATSSYNAVTTNTGDIDTMSVDILSDSDYTLEHASGSIAELTEIITYNYFLEFLDISNCKLSDLQIGLVATALSKTTTLKHLNFSHNKIVTDNTALKVASIFTSNLSMNGINLSNCHLQESGIVIICDALARIKSLTSLDISKNAITNNISQNLAFAIKENALLEQLNLSLCFEYSEDSNEKISGIIGILTPLINFRSLEYLDLHSCCINDKSAELISVVIAHNKSLSHLNLSDCKLLDKGLISIAKSLQKHFTLEYLCLSSNTITEQAACEIALAVSNNLSLQYLAMSKCELKETGIVEISKALLNVSSIKVFNLSDNNINDETTENIAAVFCNNYLIEEVNLSHNKLSTVGLLQIVNGILKTKNLKILDISHNFMTSDNLEDLATALSECLTLQRLDISQNLLTFSSVIKFAQCFRHHHSLQSLDLSNNTISLSSACEVIVDIILSVNQELIYLNVCGRGIRPRSIRDAPNREKSLKRFTLQSLHLLQPSSVDKVSIKPIESCPFPGEYVSSYYVDYIGGVFHNQYHDFTLVIPPDAVSRGDCVEIQATGSCFGPYKIPHGFYPISSFIWISADYTFKVPVYIIMSHYAKIRNLDDINHLYVLKTSTHDSVTGGKTFAMTAVPEGAYFDYNNGYCVLATDHFCSFCHVKDDKHIPEYLVASFCSYEDVVEVCFCPLNSECKKVTSS